MKVQSEFKEHESLLWSTLKQTNINRRITPLNLETEKHKFLQSRKNDDLYNPTFIYNSKNTVNDFNKVMDKLHNFFTLNINEYTPYYLQIINSVVLWERSFDEGNTEWLYNHHGEPDNDLLEYAYKNIKNKNEHNDEIEDISSQEAVVQFYSILEEYKYTGWNIKLINSPAKVSIDSLNKEISINKNSFFTPSEVKRLAVHEVGTHILRYENGKNQTFSIFQHGFDDYIECEEGLAIYSEYLTKTLLDTDFSKYCLRVIACHLTKNNSFHKVYKEISNYCDEDLAFAITTRVKRGLVDTSREFGYTKDQVYLSGFLKMKKLNIEDIKKCYVGKIGFQHLSELNFDNLNRNDISIPNWIK